MKLLSTGHTDDWQWQKLAVRAGINLLIEEYVVQADSYSVLRRVKNVIYSSSSSLFCLWLLVFSFSFRKRRAVFGCRWKRKFGIIF